MKKPIPALMLTMALVACGGPEFPNVTPIDFTGAAPIDLDVAKIEVVDDYTPPKTLPNVEHAAPTPPYVAVRNWADARLKATGSTGYVQVGIKDAHIVQKQLIGEVEYDGRIAASIDAGAGDGSRTASADVAVERRVTVDNDTSLADKVRVWDNMTREMMGDFDRGMQSAIASHLGGFVGGGASDR